MAVLNTYVNPPVRPVRGQYLAHAKLGKVPRAYLAGDLVNGALAAWSSRLLDRPRRC